MHLQLRSRRTRASEWRASICARPPRLTVGAATTFRFFHFAFPLNVGPRLSISLAGALTCEIGVELKAVCVNKSEVGVNENEITLLDIKIALARKRMMALASDARADGAEHPALEEPGLGAHP